METFTIKLSDAQIRALYEKLKSAQTLKTPPYARFAKRVEGCTITAYESNKVVLQGSDTAFYVEAFGFAKPDTQPTSQTPNANSLLHFPMSGSDEVGTGDYFGPITVVACTISQALYESLQQHEITDSKKMKDDVILSIVPTFIQLVPHSKLILVPEQYNVVHQTTNLNAIKAKMHNQAYLNLAKKLDAYPPNIIIDQFCTPQLYYKYVKDEPSVVDKIHFETKAEHKYFAVAMASVLARYYFLIAFQQQCERYDFDFLKGASQKVDLQIQAFVERFGIEKLHEVAKTHYANTEKALGYRYEDTK
ncbi:MAG: ribonuclease HIII [Erysipelotrichaceae bacterium]